MGLFLGMSHPKIFITKCSQKETFNGWEPLAECILAAQIGSIDLCASSLLFGGDIGSRLPYEGFLSPCKDDLQTRFQKYLPSNFIILFLYLSFASNLTQAEKSENNSKGAVIG